jgi:hypothetical protein
VVIVDVNVVGRCMFCYVNVVLRFKADVDAWFGFTCCFTLFFIFGLRKSVLARYLNKQSRYQSTDVWSGAVKNGEIV